MPGTFSQLLFHVVFATKHRRPFITPNVAERLYPYIGGIARAEDATLLAIGGVEDHVHLYLRLKPACALADLLRTIKSRSTKWVHETFPTLHEFQWQEGYSAFSVSKSQEPALRAYIEGQAEHHARFDFKSELSRLLDAHGIEFEHRFVFEDA